MSAVVAAPVSGGITRLPEGEVPRADDPEVIEAGQTVLARGLGRSGIEVGQCEGALRPESSVGSPPRISCDLS